VEATGGLAKLIARDSTTISNEEPNFTQEALAMLYGDLHGR